VERPAQLADEGAHRADGAVGRSVVPQVVDERSSGHDAAAGGDEDAEDLAGSRTGDRERTPVALGLDGTEHSDPHVAHALTVPAAADALIER
jgi:hypothetical protein